ncbi:MAG: helix-turn-helix transcriptional regulator [Ruminococcaceae bacterium]|nr:helix-turn-helix transcriptional regulator [Oscillospiraceae bacterium]
MEPQELHLYKQRLKLLRELFGLSYQQVADICGVTASTVRRWETTAVDIRLPYVFKLCEYYHVTVSFLSGVSPFPWLHHSECIPDMADEKENHNL